ncbi:MAG: acyl carrier protein [Sphingorhabdus sp.]
MTEEETLAKITEVVRDELDDDDIVLTRDSRADEVEGWDSLAHVRIVVAVEQSLETRFEMNDITELQTVGELIDLIQRSSG